MATERHALVRPSVRARTQRLLGGGTAGSERLTSAAGALLASTGYRFARYDMRFHTAQH
jgi:hypothetical protein